MRWAALAILHEEVEHESWFAEYLGEGPSGYFRRQGTGFERNSPHVRKFLIQFGAGEDIRLARSSGLGSHPGNPGWRRAGVLRVHQAPAGPPVPGARSEGACLASPLRANSWPFS